MKSLKAISTIRSLGKGGSSFFNPLTYNDPNGAELVAFWYSKTAEATDTQVIDAIGDETRPIHGGRCYNFDGVYDYVKTKDLGANELIIEMEFYAYMNFNVTAASPLKQVFGTYHATNTYSGLAFGASTGSLTDEVFTILNDGVAREAITGTIPAGWHHYKIVWGGLAHTIYIDGVAGTYASTGTPIQLNARQVWFATRASLSQNWAGKMYGVKITTSNRTYEYKCDETNGTTAFDSSGNKNHGTITNATLTTFHAQDIGVTYSWLNEVGYSDGNNNFPVSSTISTGWVHQSTSLAVTDFKSKGDFALKLKNTDTATGLHRSYNILSINDFESDDWIVIYAKNNGSRYFSFRITGGGIVTYDFDTQTFTTLIGITNESSEVDGDWHKITVKHDEPFSNPILQFAHSGDTELTRPDIEFTPDSTTTSIDFFVGVIKENNGYIIPTFGNKVLGLTIPRDESIPTQDVLGNPLQYSGRAKFNMDFVESNCANLDGVDDYGVMNDVALNASNSYDISVQFTMYNSGTGVVFIVDGRQSSNNGVSVLRSTGNIRYTHNASSLDTGVPIVSGQVYTVRATWDGTTINVYVDGVLAVTATDTSILTGNPLCEIGVRNPSTQASFLQGKFFNLSVTLDGVNQGHYPIAEGKGAVSYARGDETKFITWTNITDDTFWDTQDVYHSNITEGFSDNGDGVKRPYQINGEYTNPAGNWHNGAETKLQAPETPRLRQADTSNFLFTGATPNKIAHSDIVANIDDQIFADVSVPNQKKNIMVYDQVLIDPALNKVEKFTNQ